MPSVSKKQQKFMGIVRAIQKGEADPSDFNKDAQDAAKKMKKSSVKKYAKTKHKGLPTKKVSEGKLETLALNLLRNINKEIGISKYDHTKTAHFNKVMKFLRSKMPKAPDRKLGDIAMSYGDYRKKQPKATIPDIDSVKDMEKTLKKLGMKESVKESLTPAEVKKERELFKKTGELPPRLKKIADDYERERKAFYQKMKKKFKGNVKGDVEDIVVPGLEWMSKLGESAQRDYKAEYKKFQSSPKAKKYRAELNKYNRQKGTYGNGDGKDASHKGGKIVGFEAESKNRGRAEKSRLKKEINDYVGSVIDETINENPAAIAAAQRMVVQSKGKKISVNTARNSRYKDKDPAAHKKAKSLFSRLLDKFRKKNESQMLLQMAKQLKEADESVDEIKVWDLNEKCWKGYEKKGMKTMFGKRYPNCVKKKKSESVNEQSKVIKSIDNLAKKNKYGTVTGTQMNGKTANTIMKIYNHPKMKKHKKALDNFTSDELVNLTVTLPKTLGIKESVNEAPTGIVKKAIELAKSMGGNMTGAIKRIEKIKKGLSKHKDVKKALRMANESINETPYELGGMKVYSKADGLKKVK